MIINQHKLEAEPGDDLLFPDLGGIPNDSPKVQAEKRTIVIHAPANSSLEGAIGSYQHVKANKDGTPRRSMHLFIGRDGRSVVQPVGFNQGITHTKNYDRQSIGIQLEYPGQLNEKLATPFNASLTFSASEYILASSINSSSYLAWTLFPAKQLNTLLKICQALKATYTIADVVANDEISPSSHPGPAFPIAQFREKLLGVTERSYVLQELVQSVPLRGQPELNAPALYPAALPVGTQVSVLNEKGDWYLISEITPNGNSWQIGWVKKDVVKVTTDFTPTIRPGEHVLRTSEGRRIQYIQAHPNGYTQGRNNPNPNYIVMHFTTGAKMESTISTFKNPSSGVSTHLLIGRDGRVVQFLPFDAIAHHSGYSWWERKSNLNTMSIGIELDNVGSLIKDKQTGEWKRRGVTFTPDKIGRAYHEKQYRPSRKPGESDLDYKRRIKEVTPAWEKFPQVQLDMALKVVKALRERYADSMVEILGHDVVNLRNRYDPGPMFPMEDFRFELFGRRAPEVVEFTIDQPTEELYANFRGRKPNPKQGLLGDKDTKGNITKLPANSTVTIIRHEDDHDYVLVEVKASKEPKFKNATGWIQLASLSDPDPKFLRRFRKFQQQQATLKKGKKGERFEIPDRRKTLIDQPIFKRGDSSPTPLMKEGILLGKKVRIQKIENEWTLVVFIEPLNGRGGVEGWIRTEHLSPDVRFLDSVP